MALKNIKNIGEVHGGLTSILSHNKSMIVTAKNPAFHGGTKHIVIKYHVVQEIRNDGKAKLKNCKTKHQVADIFTKATID